MGPHIVRNEGPLGLFKGVDASAARQLVYSGFAWLEQVFFFPLVPFFFHFGSFGLVFVIAIFSGKNAYFLYGEALEGHQLPKNPTHAPPAPVGGALRNVRHAEGRS